MKTTINNLTTKFGCFLQAVGRVLMMPLPGSGELNREWTERFDYRVVPARPDLLKVKIEFDGLARLENVACEMPDGSTITFAKLTVTRLFVEALAMPVCGDDNVFRFFDLKKPDDMPKPDVIGEINP